MRSPFISTCKMTCDFKKKGNWAAGYHTGEDWIYVNSSNTILVSPCNGICLVNEHSESYGNYIVLKEAETGFVVLMAHLKYKSQLGVGQKVVQAQPVGYIGATGNASGVHLHIEVEERASWKYNHDLVRPSDVINFQGFYNEYFENPKEWHNGMTKEYVYSSTSDALNRKNSIGYLFPEEKALCYGIVDGCYLLVYNIGNNHKHKTGFVRYGGKIKF